MAAERGGKLFLSECKKFFCFVKKALGYAHHRTELYPLSPLWLPNFQLKAASRRPGDKQGYVDERIRGHVSARRTSWEVARRSSVWLLGQGNAMGCVQRNDPAAADHLAVGGVRWDHSGQPGHFLTGQRCPID